MKNVVSATELSSFVVSQKSEDKLVGFVPTMGALHQGHLSLVEKAKQECDVVIVSIFVNPTQFNDASDFELYPRTIDEDVELLESKIVDVVFLPTVEEVYPENYKSKDYNFAPIDEVMEGAHRPGHFAGVAMVVSRFFDIVQPDKAYFGSKDSQQLAIIKSMVEQHPFDIDIVSCPISREKNGLARSSRNKRLSEVTQHRMGCIYNVLVQAKDKLNNFTPKELESWAKVELEKEDGVEVEYVTVADSKTLESKSDWSEMKSAGIFVALFIDKVRLIDNVILF